MRLTLCALLISLPLTVRAEEHDGAIEVFPITEIKWKEAPASLPKGTQIAVLEVDPAKEGPFVFRVKVPDGYHIPPQTHPKTVRVIVISGTFNTDMGEKVDDKVAKAMPAETYGYWELGDETLCFCEGRNRSPVSRNGTVVNQVRQPCRRSPQ